jgi:hypothetical protein
MSRTTSLFELASALSGIRDQSAPGKVSVVPVLVDDLEPAVPVFQAVASLLEGRFMRTSDVDLQQPVSATTDVVRRTAVEAALTTVPDGGTRHVALIDMAGDLIDATLLEPALGADPSPGEKELLGLARAVCHRELDQVEFAVIAFREHTMDLAFRRAAWRLIVDQLADMPASSLRTLVVVSESSIDVPLHCQSGRGFRFAIESERLLRRRGTDDLKVAARQIAQHPGVTVLFLGAGFGASSRLPLGNGLRDGAIRRILSIEPAEVLTSIELATRFHKWISERGGDWLTETERALRADEFARALTLEQVIRAEKRLYEDLPTLAEFKAHHDSVVGTPGPAARDLGLILSHLKGRIVIVEVNFDRLVELNTSAPMMPFSSDDDFQSASGYLRAYFAGHETSIPVLKVHGDIDNPDSCVVSAEQTERGVGAGKLEALRELLTPKPLWIYIGASMRDRDLLPILRGEEFARALDERWVNPYLLDTIEVFADSRVAFWKDTQLRTIGDRLISEMADPFFAAWRVALGL